MKQSAWTTALGWVSLAAAIGCAGASTSTNEGALAVGEGRSACAEASGAMLGNARLFVGPEVTSRQIGRSFGAPGCETSPVVSMTYPADDGRTGAWWLDVGPDLSRCLALVPDGALLEFDPVGQSVAPKGMTAWHVTGVCAIVHQNDWTERGNLLDGLIDDEWQFWGNTP